MLLAHGSGVDSQTVVIQNSSLTLSPGETVTLTCGPSSGSVTTSNYPSWYQQTPGQAPQVLPIAEAAEGPQSGVPSRLSGSISGIKATLTNTEALPKDKADYYCALYPGSYTTTWLSGYSSYSVDWYQQVPGKCPRFLMRVSISGVGSKVDGVSDHFSGSGSGLEHYLTIQNFREEDEAEYI
ncbi:Ig lambda chain V region 4A precursor-like protein [Camelus ferus]|nr:Ig lambda chain V region 4A precursor-like protein [Camelus ferus]